MAIIDLQRRLHEAGRIRIGEQVPMADGRRRPAKLERFRFTSANRRAVDAVAAIYGGTVEPWQDGPVEGQWELFTEAVELDVVVPPEQMALTQHYELWSGGGCRRRCDGRSEELSGGPCLCDPDKRECNLTTRLSLMLARVPGVGLWRLETHSFYAALELGGSFEMATLLAEAVGRSVLPGTLRLEQKVVKRPKPSDPQKSVTYRFALPVLDFQVDMAALAVGASPITSSEVTSAPPLPALPAPSPVTAVTPRSDAPSIAEQIAAAGPPPGPARRNAAAVLPRTGRRPRTAREAEEGPTRSEPAGEDGPSTAPARPRTPPNASTPPWCADLHRRAQSLGLNEEAFDAVVLRVSNGRTSSTKDLRPRQAADLNDYLSAIEQGHMTVTQGADGWHVGVPA
jgi:hypothetical protein